MAHKVTVCLVLSKADFIEQVFHIEHLQKMKRLSYIDKLPVFKRWSLESVKQLNVQLSQQKYQAGDVIYEIGSKPEVMYILMSGKLAQETEVEIEETNRFPIGTNQWEEQVTHRRV